MTVPAKFLLVFSLILLGALSPRPVLAADDPVTPLERAIYRDVRGRVVADQGSAISNCRSVLVW